MTTVRSTILIVDDEPQNRKLLEALLSPEGYVTRTAVDGHEALLAVKEDPPDLILLDVMMPGLNGFTVTEILKSDPATASIPVIMVSAGGDRTARLEGLKAGAEDYLTKPVDRAELWLRVRNLLRLKELTDSLQQQGSLLEQQVLARTADLHQLAHYDSLTGLPNRALFHDTLRTLVGLSEQQGCDVAVLFVDIDHFKIVNDTRGHPFGDELLRQFGARLAEAVRIRDTVGRLGGDEFALIMLMADAKEGSARVAMKIIELMRQPFDVLGSEVFVTASIGIAVHPADAAEPDDLLRFADSAMYRAKDAGRNTFRFFTPEMNLEVQARLELETELRRAVERNEFTLHYQPKVTLGSGRVCGLEALLRWQRPGHGLIGPLSFVPALESTGLIVHVGSWVISEACRQMKLWMTGPVGPLAISVNVSGRQLTDGDLVQDVKSALEEHQVPPHLLELELTESMLMANVDNTITTLQKLTDLGVRISVDDFGTGYSSLAYLRRFPLNTLKIDRSFVSEITTSANDAAIAVAIITMAHSLDLDVVAEGVEDAAQLGYLRRHHCDQIQGYLFSRPLPVPELEQLLARGPMLDPEGESAERTDTLLLYGIEPARRLAISSALDGYNLLQANSVAEGLALLAVHHVQVIVCDQPTADNGGRSFLELARELHPESLRVIVGGSTDTDTMMHAINRIAIHRYYAEAFDVGALRLDLRAAFRTYWRTYDEHVVEPGQAARGRGVRSPGDRSVAPSSAGARH